MLKPKHKTMSDFDPNKLGIQIKWNLKDHFIDLFDINSFDIECANERSSHFMFENRNTETVCVQYQKTVRKQVAILEYYPEDYCRTNGIECGFMIITFSDSKRQKIKKIMWIYSDGKILTDCTEYRYYKMKTI